MTSDALSDELQQIRKRIGWRIARPRIGGCGLLECTSIDGLFRSETRWARWPPEIGKLNRGSVHQWPGRMRGETNSVTELPALADDVGVDPIAAPSVGGGRLTTRPPYGSFMPSMPTREGG